MSGVMSVNRRLFLSAAASAGSASPILVDIRSLYCMPDGGHASQPLHTGDTSLTSTDTRLQATAGDELDMFGRRGVLVRVLPLLYRRRHW